MIQAASIAFVCIQMQVVKAEMVLWTAGFVLLTLVINAPLLPMVLRLTGLNKGLVSMLLRNN